MAHLKRMRRRCNVDVGDDEKRCKRERGGEDDGADESRNLMDVQKEV